MTWEIVRMNPGLVVGLAVGLAMDAFAVALGASVRLQRVSPRQVFRFAFHFGLFQAMMPLIGWMAGGFVEAYVSRWDHWVAFGLLACVGGKAIREALMEESDEDNGRRGVSDPTRGLSLVVLSVATSLDALAVGLTFAMLEVRIWLPVAVIGVVTAGLTTLGMLFGARLGVRFGRRVEVLGGVVLIGIGLKILFEGMFGAGL